MKLGDINDKIKGLNLPEKDIKALLNIIDIKTDSDMREVIIEIKSLNTKLDSSIGALRSEINISNNKIDNIKWTIGGIIAVVGAIVALVIKFVK